MKSLSFYTNEYDAYEAGCLIGERFQTISPEIIILFAAPHYAKNTDLLDGIIDTIKDKNTIIYGCSANGTIHNNKAHSGGVCALAINSDKKIKWVIKSDSFANKAPEQAAKNCAKKLVNEHGNPKTSMIFTTVTKKVDDILKSINKHITTPVFGGCASDEGAENTNVIFLNDKILHSSFSMLGMYGDFDFSGNYGFGWVPVGNIGTITKAKNDTIYEIDNKPANHFISGQLGKKPNPTDKYILSIASYRNLEDPTSYTFKSLDKIDEKNENFSVFATVKEGETIRPSSVTYHDLQNGVNSALKKINGKHKVAIAITCVGRKWLMGNDTSMEAKMIFDFMSDDTQIIGFPSYGEIGSSPIKDVFYTAPEHLNTSIVIFTLDC